MDFFDGLMDNFIKKHKIKIILIVGSASFFFLIVIAVIFQVSNGGMNSIQSVAENSSSTYVQGKTGYETGMNAIFSTLCKGCKNSGESLKGLMDSEFYQKMSEALNLYNSLEKGKERKDDFDFQLLTATITLGKYMKAELFSESADKYKWLDGKVITNKDISPFPEVTDIGNDLAPYFFQWAAVMLGTPYSLPDINLRGLLGSLISGKIVSSCESGLPNRNKEQQLEDLINEIIRVENKLAGNEQDNSFWNSILSLFGISYTNDTKVLKDRLKEMFEDLENKDGAYKDLEPFINMADYDPNIKCSSGSGPKNTYTKFMNYEQYKEYLRVVFLPENYINCDNCYLRNASEEYKQIKIDDYINEIFKEAEEYHDYSGMSDFEYDNVTYGTSPISPSDLNKFSSPLKSACSVTTSYGLREGIEHRAVDTVVSGDNGLYAIADGTVISVIHYTDNNYQPNKKFVCPDVSSDKWAGVQIIIKHNIGGSVYYSSYNHVNPTGILVSADSADGKNIVKRGQKIAVMGNSGCSTGDHLHFEMFKDSQTTDNIIDPTFLFKQCDGSNFADQLTIETTDDYVNSKKCMTGDYTLDELITSIIKKKDGSASSQKEYVKATAIVIRTKLMEDSNWCKKSLGTSVSNLNIQSNPLDLALYNQVIETQGMILNYTGEPIKELDYAMFPCEKLPTNWNNGNRSRVLSVLGISDTGSKLDLAMVDAAVREYNTHCVSYGGSSSNISVNLGTIPYDLHKYKKINQYVEFTIPSNFITKKEKDAQNSYSLNIAKYMSSKGMDYTQILNEFYQAKTANPSNLSENVGYIDISTSPGLLDAQSKLLSLSGNNSSSFEYGDTLAGSNITPTGSVSENELNTINDHLTNYISNAATKAKEKSFNESRAKAAAAAYWLVNNPFYRVQYSLNSTYSVDGFNKNWSSSNGLDSAGFILWSLRQAGGGSYYGTPSVLESSKIFSETETTFTVDQLISLGIQVGDVIRKSNPSGHWAIVTKVDSGTCSIEVAHAVNEQNDLDLTTYTCGTAINYQKIYKLPQFYKDS